MSNYNHDNVEFSVDLCGKCFTT